MRKKIKFKSLILLIFVLSTSRYSLDIFADTSSENSLVTENKSTILDGEIGEWDPEITDKPNFNKSNLEIDGNIPNEENYYTISVTVPLEMEFFVLPNSKYALGSFHSPVYIIKNNGSKNMSVNVSSFTQNEEVNNEDTTPLYIAPVRYNDGRTQMELKLVTLVDMIYNRPDNEVDLTELNNQKELCRLNANEEKGVRFLSERWEIPEVESGKKQAISNFTVGFVFSINR